MSFNSPPLHGSVIAWEGRGVLFLGEPGSGKSSLALECIDQGAQLVADDAVLLRAEGAALFASSPESVKALLALRGLGILHMPFLETTRLDLVIQLDEHLKRSEYRLHGHTLPCLHMARDYPARLAVIRQSLRMQSSSPLTAWLPDDWHPMQRSA